MKYGNLNFLEPSGPLQTCNGTALAVTFQSSPNTDQIKEDEMGRACGMFEDERKCMQGLE